MHSALRRHLKLRLGAPFVEFELSSGRTGALRPEQQNRRSRKFRNSQPHAAQNSRGQRRLTALSFRSSDRFGSTGLRPTCSLSDHFWSGTRKRGSMVIESMVRDRVIRRLDEEEMEIMPLDCLPMWAHR